MAWAISRKLPSRKYIMGALVGIYSPRHPPLAGAAVLERLVVTLRHRTVGTDVEARPWRFVDSESGLAMATPAGTLSQMKHSSITCIYTGQATCEGYLCRGVEVGSKSWCMTSPCQVVKVFTSFGLG